MASSKGNILENVELINSLNETKAILNTTISYHSEKDIFELSCVAGQTNFNLEKESSMKYSELK